MAEMPRARLYSEGTWFVYAFLPGAEIGPKQFTFPAETPEEVVVESVQRSLDQLYVKCKRHVVFTRYHGSMQMMQGGS